MNGIMDIDDYLDNDDWIDKFEKIDKSYSNFYLEDVYSLKLYFIYIDRQHNIQKVKHEKMIMRNPNIISREEIISIIKNNCDSKKYSLLTILKYNIDLDNTDIRDYLKNTPNHEYLTSVKYIDAIPFHQTISMFQDLNNLFFLFSEKTQKNSKNKTRKLIL